MNEGEKEKNQHMTKETWCIDFSTAVLQTSCFILTSSQSLFLCLYCMCVLCIARLFVFLTSIVLLAFFSSSSSKEKKITNITPITNTIWTAFRLSYFSDTDCSFVFFPSPPSNCYFFLSHRFFCPSSSSCIRSCIVLSCLILFYRFFWVCVCVSECIAVQWVANIFFPCVAVRFDSLWNFVTVWMCVWVSVTFLFSISHIHSFKSSNLISTNILHKSLWCFVCCALFLHRYCCCYSHAITRQDSLFDSFWMQMHSLA